MNKPYQYEPTDSDNLNKRIAERVGWTHVRWGTYFTSNDERIETFIGVKPGDEYNAEWDELESMDRIPQYTTSVDAALTLDFELNDQDERCIMISTFEGEVSYDVKVTYGDDRSSFSFGGLSMSRVICLSWLYWNDNNKAS